MSGTEPWTTVDNVHAPRRLSHTSDNDNLTLTRDYTKRLEAETRPQAWTCPRLSTPHRSEGI